MLRVLKIEGSCRCNMLLTKYFHPFGVVWCLWKKLESNLGVWCYLHNFLQLLEGVRCYLEDN